LSHQSTPQNWINIPLRHATAFVLLEINKNSRQELLFRRSTNSITLLRHLSLVIFQGYRSKGYLRRSINRRCCCEIGTVGGTYGQNL